MTHFWTKFQIFGLFVSQDKNFTKILKKSESIVGNVFSNNSRSFFFRRRSDDDKSKDDRRPTICGKPLPVKQQPCNPDCSSKCLCLPVCKDKESAMRKLSNCRDIASVEKPKSFWEIYFGWKREIPIKKDRKNCRLVECEKRKSRERDPRLNDSRYEATAGDVLIFTERPKANFCKPQERRPKSPPAHKLPKAVMSKRIIQRLENTPHDCAAALIFDASCESKCSAPKSSILPFEELRPPERQRRLFSCKNGIRSKDVPKPIRSDDNTVSATRENSGSVADVKSKKNNNCSEFSMDIGSRGNSRVEQLKKLMRSRDGCKCSEVFDNNTLNNISKCQTPCHAAFTSTLSSCQNDSSGIR